MSRRVVPVFLLAALALAGGPAAAEEAKTAAASPLPAKPLFDHKCGMCHLENGIGTFMLGRRLGEANGLLEKRTNLTPEYVRQIVRWGLNGMPRFSRVEVTESELQAIAQYLSASK